MQFLARSLSKSIRPFSNSRARQSWVLSQKCHSSFSATKSRSFTRGGSSSEESESIKSPEWPRPTEIPYQPKIANSADLIGYVNQPIQFHAKPDGSFWAGTVITHGPPSASESESDLDSTHKFWIPVIFEGDLAHTANCHLKKNDRVYITGQIFVDVSEVSGAKPDQAYVHVMARDLRYIQGSKPLPKVLPASDQKEDVLKHSASLKKRRDFDCWYDLIEKPEEWCDYRERKQSGSVNPRHPDFKKKDGSVALWLNNAPSDILPNLKDVNFDVPVRSKYAKQPKAGEESWKDLVENMNKWWDNREGKRHPKSPDFKHKETGVVLWLSNSPSWVIERLPPPKSKTSDSH
ncbi:hypothetical protein EUTSA_v10008085mg [Eutrema salsugineum]|uniref:Uncharacterized protein n=1 Tax=Eutrema salsugineum TaxID=72664 RepID=V4KR14_EUTSA|nr:protein OSB4, chloroplastic [Eutrema salsugineum]ESQ33734.1 hypothetical protein EUTSA_v10008085mg [Eutrema salsugineum]